MMLASQVVAIHLPFVFCSVQESQTSDGMGRREMEALLFVVMVVVVIYPLLLSLHLTWHHADDAPRFKD
jgi:hypothetical protein